MSERSERNPGITYPKNSKPALAGDRLAIANLKCIKRNKEKLLRNVAEMSDYFMTRLSQMEFKYPVAVRKKGLAIGVGLGSAGVGRCGLRVEAFR